MSARYFLKNGPNQKKITFCSKAGWTHPWVANLLRSSFLFFMAECLEFSRGPAHSEHSANVMEGITEQSHTACLECSWVGQTLKRGSAPCSKNLAGSLSFSHQDAGGAHLICFTGLWAVCCLGGLWNRPPGSKNKATFWKHAGDDNDYHMRFSMGRESVLRSNHHCSVQEDQPEH